MSNLAVKDMEVACEFSPGSYTAIANLESFSGPNMEIDHYEVSYINDDWVTKKPTVINAGQCSLVLGYDADNSTHASLRTNFAAGTVKSFRITFTDASPQTFTFDAFVKSFEVVGGTSRDQSKANVNLEISGEVTVA